tara:strand:- start:99 stop:677 length:579 start_codon:yes stop_codon:yes gene_type:complete
MVSSGLIDNNDVSHFRLSLHLSLALFLISLIFWFILDLSNIGKFESRVSNLLLFIILTLIILQIILGSFLSGLDGGLIYNTWPDMNGTFFPYDTSFQDLNSKIFYDISIIQFLHRKTAYILLIFIIILNYIFFKKKLNLFTIIFFNIAILSQIFLGIITLISGVEIKYASLHQLGSIFVLSTYLLILYKNTN